VRGVQQLELVTTTTLLPQLYEPGAGEDYHNGAAA